ncbi:hypothetical protein HPB49_010080 [Dermacentor silvarum]|uniref:Uncharacterized protein n=1 Tax=Dermacentor silvarum TaxID=543639 RepID=A0ACB8CX30_DERSI|nr:hypothetical protein HPB49_010080 [Dermacentor silvarum]
MPSMRRIAVGGSAISSFTAEAARGSFGDRNLLRNVYGMTESCGLITSQPKTGETQTATDVGVPLAGVQIKVGPMKKFRNKKEMFGRIAENLNKTMGITRTGEQCCSRFKTVIRRKTSATTQNKKSGNSPSDVPYDEELAKIAALDDSVEPEELRDGYGVVSRRDTGSVSSKKGSYSSSEEAEETPEFEESQSSQSTQSSSSTGQTNTAERQKTRSPRVSTSRLQDMKFFLEEIKELHAQKEAQRAARHEERKKQKEESREEKARQHKEKMAMLSRLLGITATSERENK